MKAPKKKKLFSPSAYFVLFLLPTFILLSFPAEAQEAVTKLKVVTEMANVRLKPDIGSIIIQQAPQGTILESIAKEGEWYLIKIKNEEGQIVSGYVHESVVIVLEGRAQEREKIETEKAPEREVKKEPQEEKKEKKPLPQPEATKAAPQPSKFRIEFCFSGGASYASAADLNNGAKGVADWRKAELDQEQLGTVSLAHFSYIIGGELTFSLSSHLYAGLGADYFQAQKESEVKFLVGPVITETLTIRPKFQALPLRIFLVYQPFSFFYMKGGLEYYFAKCSYLYNFQRAAPLNQSGEAKAQNFGLMGAMGLERKLSSALSFFLELTGRYAKIKGFKGTHTEIDAAGTTSRQEGKLYYFYRRESPEGPLYPQLYVREKSPTGAEYEPREAVMDFSGLSFKAGFKIKF
jgi:hypothetical protein